MPVHQNSRAGKCCPDHHGDERTPCCSSCPMEHTPIPVWRSVQGQRYCASHREHQAYVQWPCEQAA